MRCINEDVEKMKKNGERKNAIAIETNFYHGISCDIIYAVSK